MENNESKTTTAPIEFMRRGQKARFHYGEACAAYDAQQTLTTKDDEGHSRRCGDFEVCIEGDYYRILAEDLVTARMIGKSLRGMGAAPKSA